MILYLQRMGKINQESPKSTLWLVIVRSPTPPKITRRSATRLLGGALISGLASSSFARKQQPAAPSPTYTRLLSDEDLDFLEEMEHAACLYFSEQVDSASGQVLDRADCKN